MKIFAPILFSTLFLFQSADIFASYTPDLTEENVNQTPQKKHTREELMRSIHLMHEKSFHGQASREHIDNFLKSHGEDPEKFFGNTHNKLEYTPSYLSEQN